MFETILEVAYKKLRENGSNSDLSSAIDFAASIIIMDTAKKELDNVKRVMSEHDDFIKRNRDRWSLGFVKLHALRETCLQAGVNFQQQLIKIPKY